MASTIAGPTSVYIIACGDLVKIGVSRDPAARLKSLKTGSPYRPHIAATREFTTRRRAHDMETRLHRFFARHREHGEWFRVTASQAARAMRTLELHNPRTADKVVAEAFRKLMEEPTLFP